MWKSTCPLLYWIITWMTCDVHCQIVWVEMDWWLCNFTLHPPFFGYIMWKIFHSVYMFQLQPGYERLCCLRCMQPRDHNFGTTCVCRVPKHLREEKIVECVHCGCKGCASGDWLMICCIMLNFNVSIFGHF